MARWRITPARNQRKPLGFIQPCQPSLAREILAGPGWVHELKWDGYRIVAHREQSATRLWSRKANNWAAAFPDIVDAIELLPGASVVIDGEAVCLLEDGRPDFHALRSMRACREAQLVAFDLLAFGRSRPAPAPA